MYERTISTKRIFTGRILSLDLEDVELEDGSRSQRELIRHRGAVGVVCRMADGRFLFVRQFRKAIDDYCLEIVAGLLEEGETPSACARREVREETGFEIGHLIGLGRTALSPGYSNEYIHLFYADLASESNGQSLDEGEHVYLVVLSPEEIGGMLARGEIVDGKTLAAWLLYEKSVAGGER